MDAMGTRLEDSIVSLSEQVLVVASKNADLFKQQKELKAGHAAELTKLKEELKASNTAELAKLQEQLEARNSAELTKLQEKLKASNTAELMKMKEKVSDALKKVEDQVKKLEEGFRQNGATSVTDRMGNDPEQGIGHARRQRQFRRKQQPRMNLGTDTGPQLTLGEPAPVTPRAARCFHARRHHVQEEADTDYEYLKLECEEVITVLEAHEAKAPERENVHKLMRETPSKHCPKKKN
jgi:hypothetical protein